jgi:hypothetical protein
VAAAAASEVAAARASLAGTKLRDYEIIRKVGGKDTEATPTIGGGYSQSGVCSYVYLARRVGDARHLAVKVMINMAGAAHESAAIGREFEAEHRLLANPARLPPCPHVISVLHSFTDMVRVGFGHIVTSETEVPILLVNLV